MKRIFMFGFGKKDSLTLAGGELEREFGIKLDDIPDRTPVDELFNTLRAQGTLTHESCVALLYRLVALNFLAACKMMSESGQVVSPDRVIWLTQLLDRSVDWSEKAADHVVLERLTSKLNQNIEKLLSSFGVRRGGD
jgi:hypothetical protein